MSEITFTQMVVEREKIKAFMWPAGLPYEPNIAVSVIAAIESLKVAMAESHVSRDAAMESEKRAVAFASRVEREELHFAKVMDNELEAIAALPVGKTIHESISMAVARVLATLNGQRLAAVEAGQARARLLADKYVPWTNAGGPDECAHGRSEGIDCPKCDRETVDRFFAGVMAEAPRVEPEVRAATERPPSSEEKRRDAAAPQLADL